MSAFRGRAIIASPLPDEADALCAMLMEIGFSETVCVGDGLSAVRCAQERMTDAIIADAVLPVLDGYALAQRISITPMRVYPAVVLMTAGGMCLNASVRTLEKPSNAAEIAEALDDLQPQRRAIPEEKRDCARRMLDMAGIPEHPGREYLLRAIEIVWLDARLLKPLSSRVYPAVAEQFGADAKQIARAMRHVIDAAWRGGEMELQYKIFGDTIDAKRGCPTPSEMIARIADILRWEGKA